MAEFMQTLLMVSVMFLVLGVGLVLLRFSGELFAHCRSAISNWTGLR